MSLFDSQTANSLVCEKQGTPLPRSRRWIQHHPTLRRLNTATVGLHTEARASSANRQGPRRAIVDLRCQLVQSTVTQVPLWVSSRFTRQAVSLQVRVRIRLSMSNQSLSNKHCPWPMMQSCTMQTTLENARADRIPASFYNRSGVPS